MEVSADKLTENMFAAEDIRTTSGQVVAGKGEILSEALRLHLQACAEVGSLAEPFKVEVVTAEYEVQASQDG